MKIDFNKIQTAVIEHFKGGEKHFDVKMFEDEKNRIMQATLVPGASIGLHAHSQSSEIIFVIEGEGTMLINGDQEKLTKGDCHYCPKGSQHTLINKGTEDLRFFAVVPVQ